MSKNYMNDSQASEIMKFISDTMKFPIMGAGGGFASLGAECYHEGTIAPVGWLICDGSTHNIADYPELATYYASHYGASNHFGGDGVTTFAVPTRNGMPTSGVDSPDEHIVGEWRETVNGVLKKKPIYKKSIIGQATTDKSTYVSIGATNSLIPNMETLIDSSIKVTGDGASAQYHTFCDMHISDYDKIQVKQSYASSSQTFTYYIVVKYTKSTDSWQTVQEGHSSDGNGIFCVKATVAGDPNAHHYSTEEQIVGMDEDGNYIYEKTINGLNVSMSGDTFTAIPSFSISANNISIVREAKGMNTDKKISFPLITYVDGDTLKVMISRPDSTITILGMLIIQYTKNQ